MTTGIEILDDWYRENYTQEVLKGFYRSIKGDVHFRSKTPAQEPSMTSSLNRRYADVMTDLESSDPHTYKTIKAKMEALKTEAATWRRKAQAVTTHGETPKMAFDGEGVHQ